MLTFQAARPTDWPAIEALLVQAALPREGAREHLGAFLLTWDDAVLVGTAAVESYGACGLLRSVAVAASHRDRGIGAALVTALTAQARQRGTRTLHLLTTTAKDYFGARGFVEAARDTAPAALEASAEFRGACPASASFMTLALAP
jgi:N-acetylglutamate synthase-like GNAT family acetyltransferase